MPRSGIELSNTPIRSLLRKLLLASLTFGFDLLQHSLLPKQKGQEVNLPARSAF